MRPLLIGPEQVARVAQVKAHAEANVVAFARIYRMAHGLEAPYYSPEILVEIPFGFRVVYGVEEQELGVFRHLSVSVDGEDRWPNPVSVEALLTLFGMPPLEKCCYIYTQPLMGAERRNVVNVLDPFCR